MNRFFAIVGLMLACGTQAADLDFLARHAKIDAPTSILYLGDSLTDFDRGSNHVDKLQLYLNKYNPGKVTIRNVQDKVKDVFVMTGFYSLFDFA